jgi:hypothetical protein
LTCLRCDGKGEYRNEFGLMEKCESCQRSDMTFEKVDDQDSDEWYWILSHFSFCCDLKLFFWKRNCLINKWLFLSNEALLA